MIQLIVPSLNAWIEIFTWFWVGFVCTHAWSMILTMNKCWCLCTVNVWRYTYFYEIGANDMRNFLDESDNEIVKDFLKYYYDHDCVTFSHIRIDKA